MSGNYTTVFGESQIFFIVFLASHPVDELASATEIPQVIAIVSDSIGKRKHTLDRVAIDTIDTIKGIGKHRIAMSLRNRLANETKGGNNKVI